MSEVMRVRKKFREWHELKSKLVDEAEFKAKIH